MNKSKLILKLALYVAYALFAGFSAYFTATSFSLNLLHTDKLLSFVIVYVLVFIVAVMAGWCLTKFIEEMRKKRGASKMVATFSFLGFLIFWIISFTTNVHFFFIEKHGFSILGQELSSAKNYINENTEKSNREIENKKEDAISLVTGQVSTNILAFDVEIQKAIDYGFGPACVNILNSTEDILNGSRELYGEKNITYVIFDERADASDIGTTQKTKVLALYSKYKGRMEQARKMKVEAIERYYNAQMGQNKDLLALLQPISVIENTHYPVVAEDGSANAYFKCQQFQQHNVIDKMPPEFLNSCIEYDANGEVEKINVYPSARMFETATVWVDMFKHRLPGGMPMIQWIILSLIFDIMAFLLFALAKLN